MSIESGMDPCGGTLLEQYAPILTFGLDVVVL